MDDYQDSKLLNEEYDLSETSNREALSDKISPKANRSSEDISIEDITKPEIQSFKIVIRLKIEISNYIRRLILHFGFYRKSLIISISKYLT